MSTFDGSISLHTFLLQCIATMEEARTNSVELDMRLPDGTSASFRIEVVSVDGRAIELAPDQDDLSLALECGAISFSPPPLRAVRGLSFTYAQLERFVSRVEARAAMIAKRQAEHAPDAAGRAIDVPDGYKLVMVPDESAPDEPDWEECIRQAEVSTGLTVERNTFSIVKREIRRWIAHRAEASQDSDVDRQALIDWVAASWHSEVANRPMVNIHRRSLDDTWRQVLRHLGVDDRARLGPTHDELRSQISSKEWEAMNEGRAPKGHRT